MQTVYLVWSYPAESYDDESAIIAVYADRQAAELHVLNAEEEHRRIMALGYAERRAASSAWDPELSGPLKCFRRYSISERLLCDHPDQWQDSKEGE